MKDSTKIGIFHRRYKSYLNYFTFTKNKYKIFLLSIIFFNFAGEKR